MSKIILFIFMFFAYSCVARDGSGNLKGRLITESKEALIHDAQLLFPKLKQLFSADTGGVFFISQLPYGTYTIHVLIDGELVDSFSISLDQKEVNLGDIVVSNISIDQRPLSALVSDIPVIALERIYADEDGAGMNTNVSVLLNSAGTRDPFLNAATFVFGQYYFRPRGYGRQSQQVYINGILMNDPGSGNVVWTGWSGLNDVFKNQSLTYGPGLHQQAYGGLNGTLYFEAGAFEQRTQSKVSYSLSNRAYNNRIMFTHSSGQRKSGWAYTFSASRRWAGEGYVPGTFLDALSGFLSLGKILNEKSQLTFTLIANRSVRGRSGAATDEVYHLTNNRYYNPNWGWQENEKRNARISNLFRPIGILQYQYKIAEQLQVTTSLGFQTGLNRISSLDWYNAIDPRPDYYRNLPGYYAATPAIANQIREELSAQPERLQLDWSRLYNTNSANRETLYGLNGTADSLRANRSLYVTGADEEYMSRISWGSNVQYKSSEKLTLSGGSQLTYQHQKVYLRLKGLYVCNNHGTPQLGAFPVADNSGLKQVSAVQPGDFAKYIVLTNVSIPISPPVVRMSYLSEPRKEFINRLIKIEQTELANPEQDVQYADATATTSIKMQDCNGASIVLRTSNYADFQSYPTAYGMGSITAIYTIYNGGGQLTIRDTSDVKMGQVRCDGSSRQAPTSVTIKALREMYKDKDTLPGHLSISGIVTSDAVNRNFGTGNIIVQQGKSAVMVYFGSQATDIPDLGDSVRIRLSGTTLTRYNGILEVKNIKTLQVDILSSEKTIEPIHLDIAELNNRFAELESVLVKISNAKITASGNYAGNKTLKDATGTIVLYTSNSAVFANTPVPVITKTFQGIVTPYNTTNELKIRTPMLDVY